MNTLYTASDMNTLCTASDMNNLCTASDMNTLYTASDMNTLYTASDMNTLCAASDQQSFCSRILICQIWFFKTLGEIFKGFWKQVTLFTACTFIRYDFKHEGN